MKRGDVFAPLRMKGTDLYPPCMCEQERRVSSEVKGYLQAFLFHMSGNPTNQDLPAFLSRACREAGIQNHPGDGEAPANTP
jgi:hypothetical protein